MQLEVLDRKGNVDKSIEVSDSNFDAEFNGALVHQVSVACRAASRSGTHAQKNRSAVRGGGAKPHRQKGTGRARAGTKNSNLFRGGGRAFPNSPRDYSQKVNRKSFRVAMRSVLSETLRRGNLVVVNEMQMETPKTRDVVSCLGHLNCKSALIVDENVSDNLNLAARNIPNVFVIAPSMLNPANVIDCGRIVMTESAVEFMDRWLS
ncbi:MAG: 50S ribosomal protein L4 [Acidiferrobacterales bacterium]|nr:50S ribosomal protein L4 [Acidiferrobacterales bacterium]